jgi:hypothetical protein
MFQTNVKITFQIGHDLLSNSFQFTFHNVVCSLIWLHISFTNDTTTLNSFCIQTRWAGNIIELHLQYINRKEGNK